MDWYKILSALFAIGMLIYIFPRAKHMLNNSPKGNTGQWLNFIGILVLIVLFVFFLVSVV